MIKKILVVLGYGILWTALVIAVLLLTNHYTLQPLISFFQKLRGTEGYEGEEKGLEGMKIVEVIFLTVFVITVGIVAVVLRRKNKKRGELH